VLLRFRPRLVEASKLPSWLNDASGWYYSRIDWRPRDLVSVFAAAPSPVRPRVAAPCPAALEPSNVAKARSATADLKCMMNQDKEVASNLSALDGMIHRPRHKVR